MIRTGHWTVGGLVRLGTALVAAALLAAAGLRWGTTTVAAQEIGASVRVVHAVSDVGPLDLYIDGRLAVVGAAFPSATDPLALSAGNHRVTVVPSGAGVDTALVDTVLDVAPGTSEEVAIVGSAAGVSAIRFPVDDASLDADRSRMRVVHASPDAGPVEVALTGGEAIFPPVEYPAATEYAETPPGAFAIDLVSPETVAVVASLPDLVLAPGEVADVYLLGQVADGSLQTLVVRTQVQITPLVGRPVALREGTCAEPGPIVADLGLAAAPRGPEVGSATGAPVESGFGSAPVSFDLVVATPHVLVVAASELEDAEGEACGPVGGVPTDDGSLAIPLVDGGSAARGVAVLAPGVLDPSTIDVSVFVFPETAVAPPADPAPAAGVSGGAEPAQTSDRGGANGAADGGATPPSQP